jgi:hypothetical protein
MGNINTLTFVIDAASGTTTDNVKELNQFLYVGATLAKQVQVCRFLNIIPLTFKKKAPNAATQSVDTITFTGTANATEYSFSVRQYSDASRQYYTRTYAFVTPATGTISPTTIALQAKTLLDADPQYRATVVAALGVLTCTTEAGFETIKYATITGSIAMANTTPGVEPYGITPYYALTQWGLVAGVDFIGSTAGYTTYQFDYFLNYAPDVTVGTAAVQTCFIAINGDDADAAALVTAIDAIFAQAAFNTQTVKVA